MYPREMETGSKERDGGRERKSLAYERGSVRGVCFCERFCVIVLGRILERGINNWPILRTGCQFGVPGCTFPPKKYPTSPQGYLLVSVSRFK